jgi:serine/threonine-protein phosphatase 2A activator
MSFMYFCWALFRLGFCASTELEQLVRHLFYRYINLMRKVQVQYMLEPAGSHGVWGLDDYHFLPFLLGAS